MQPRIFALGGGAVDEPRVRWRMLNYALLGGAIALVVGLLLIELLAAHTTALYGRSVALTQAGAGDPPLTPWGAGVFETLAGLALLGVAVGGFVYLARLRRRTSRRLGAEAVHWPLSEEDGFWRFAIALALAALLLFAGLPTVLDLALGSMQHATGVIDSMGNTVGPLGDGWLVDRSNLVIDGQSYYLSQHALRASGVTDRVMCVSVLYGARSHVVYRIAGAACPSIP